MQEKPPGQPELARITIYPFKSLDGVDVPQAAALSGAGLQYDRRFALTDGNGEFINGKRTEAIHRLRFSIDLEGGIVHLRARDQAVGGSFDLGKQRLELADWLRQYFGYDEPLNLLENLAGGFPDDTDSPGPTVVSTATLEAVADWFPGLTVDEVRRRFRANLEIAGVEAFWEDCLCAEGDQVVRFALGEWELEGTNPCQRCVVPTRDSNSGTAVAGFAKQFAEQREARLPPWAAASRFDHFYRLAVNTRPARQQTAQIRIGDRVRVLGVFPK